MPSCHTAQLQRMTSHHQPHSTTSQQSRSITATAQIRAHPCTRTPGGRNAAPWRAPHPSKAQHAQSVHTERAPGGNARGQSSRARARTWARHGARSVHQRVLGGFFSSQDHKLLGYNRTHRCGAGARRARGRGSLRAQGPPKRGPCPRAGARHRDAGLQNRLGGGPRPRAHTSLRSLWRAQRGRGRQNRIVEGRGAPAAGRPGGRRRRLPVPFPRRSSRPSAGGGARASSVTVQLGGRAQLPRQAAARVQPPRSSGRHAQRRGPG